MAAAQKTVGVFIDAENLPARCIARVLEIAAGYGRIVERRVYGDFIRESLRPWVSIVPQHALSLQTATTTTSGKNSSDILLAIDVMELMSRQKIDVFCIATSDSDFAQLASRLRMRGYPAIGIGGKNASGAFRVAFDAFFELEVETKAAQKPAPANVVALKGTDDIRPLIVQAIQFLGIAPNDWIDIGRLGSAIRQVKPGFSPKNFGSAKFSTVLKNCDFLDRRLNSAETMEVKVRVTAKVIAQKEAG